MFWIVDSQTLNYYPQAASLPRNCFRWALPVFCVWNSYRLNGVSNYSYRNHWYWSLVVGKATISVASFACFRVCFRWFIFDQANRYRKKTFDKLNNHSWFTLIENKRLKIIFFQTDKGLTSYVMVKDQMLSSYDQEQSRNAWSHHFFQHCSKVLISTVREDKKIKHIQIGKEQVNLSLLKDDILHT